MSNAWIDDRFYGEAWVRICGPIAAHIYLAATNIIHRRASDSVRVTRQQIEDELPWPVSEADIEAALVRLEAREKVIIDGDEIAFPDYVAEQEPHDRREDRSKRGRAAANARWGEERARKRCPTHARSIDNVRDACPEHVTDASGPIRSGPDHPSGPSGYPPEARESASPPRDVPRETVPAKPPKPPKPKRLPHPMRQVYLDEFHQAHKTSTGGSIYTWDGHDRARLDRACETYPLDRWRAACAGYARRLPEWLFRDGSAPDLQGMIRNFNAFAAAACGPPPDRPAGPNGRLSIEQILAYKRPTNGQ